MSTGYGRYYIFEGLSEALDELVSWCQMLGIEGCARTHPHGHLTFWVSDLDLRPRPVRSMNHEIGLPPLPADIEALLGLPARPSAAEQRLFAAVEKRDKYGDPRREAEVFLAFANEHDGRLFRYVFSDRSYICGLIDFQGLRSFQIDQHTITLRTPDGADTGEYPRHFDPEDPDGLLDDYDQEELDACEEVGHAASNDDVDLFEFSIEAWEELCEELLWRYGRSIVQDWLS